MVSLEVLNNHKFKGSDCLWQRLCHLSTTFDMQNRAGLSSCGCGVQTHHLIQIINIINVLVLYRVEAVSIYFITTVLVMRADCGS